MESGGTGCRRYYRGGIILDHGNRCRRIYGPRYHLVVCHRRTGLLFRRIMLCRICLDDPGGRQCLHLFVCNDGRTDRMDHRLGSRTRIYRSCNDRQYQLEPLPCRLSRRVGNPFAANAYRLSLGWRDRQRAGFPDRCPDEPLPDPGDGREFDL